MLIVLIAGRTASRISYVQVCNCVYSLVTYPIVFPEPVCNSLISVQIVSTLNPLLKLLSIPGWYVGVFRSDRIRKIYGLVKPVVVFLIGCKFIAISKSNNLSKLGIFDNTPTLECPKIKALDLVTRKWYVSDSIHQT